MTNQQIQESFEKRIGQGVAPSTISRLLHRHQWRKVVHAHRSSQMAHE